MIPGFVDLQVNGFVGVNFSDPTVSAEKLAEACRTLLSRGTAAFLPTVITAPVEVYQRNLPLLAGLMRQPEFRGRLLGIHLEGPFISPRSGAVGAHDERHVRPCSIPLLRQMIEWSEGSIRMLTLAAELDGAAELAAFAAEQGITVSLGHQLAMGEDLDRLVAAGAKSLTHLGNALPGTLPRHQNPIWPALANDDLSATIIADGHHLPPAVLKTFLRAKGVGRTIVVSDASPIAGLAAGTYRAFGLEVVLESGGRVFNPARQCMAGSSATMLHCMNHLHGLSNWLTLEDLLAMGFYNPLRLVGLPADAVQAPASLGFDPKTGFFLKK